MAGSEGGSHAVPARYYFYNFLFLLVMLMLTVWVSFHHYGDWINVAIMLTIAVAKMVAIILIFMNVWWSSRLTMVFAASGFLWLVILFVLTLADFATRPMDDAMVKEGIPKPGIQDEAMRTPEPH